MPYIDTKHYDIYYDIQDIRIESPLFEVDEFIAPIISILNRKGYTTEFCCSGHSDDAKISTGFTVMHDNCYITFSNIDNFKNSSKDIPNNFRLEPCDYDNKKFTIRKYYKELGVSRYLEILDTMKYLLEWTINLPYANL